MINEPNSDDDHVGSQNTNKQGKKDNQIRALESMSQTIATY